MTVAETIESAVAWAESIAADDTHLYSQDVRWGPSYDCSSLLITAWELAGVPLKTNGASSTKSMASVMLANGFERITNGINFNNGEGFQRGDIILQPSGESAHVVMSVGNGQIVEAYRGDVARAEQIRVREYYSFGATSTYRYVGFDVVEETTFTIIDYPNGTKPEIVNYYDESTVWNHEGNTIYLGYTSGDSFRIRTKFHIDVPVKSVDVYLKFRGTCNVTTTSAGFCAAVTAEESVSPPENEDTTFLWSINPAEATFTITKDLMPGDYYLWLWYTNKSVFVSGAFRDRFVITISGAQKNCTVTLPTGAGYIASGNSGEIEAGSDYMFSVTILPPYVAGSGFAVTANGVVLELTEDGVYVIKNVNADQVVEIVGVVIGGLVRIANGSSFDDYIICIANGSSFDQVMPYIANGASFDLYS